MKKTLTLLALGMFFAPSAHAAFDTDLRYGSSGAPVFELQEFLTSQGVYSGPITGNFYALTLAGVKALQTKLNVEPQSGFFGPLTRQAASKVLAVDLEESDKEASSTPVVITDDKPKSNGNTSRNVGSTGGGTQTIPPYEVHLVSFDVASTSVTVHLDADADRLHIILDDGKGEPGGMMGERKDARTYILGWIPVRGEYSWKATVSKYGASKHYHPDTDPNNDNQRSISSGSLEIH